MAYLALKGLVNGESPFSLFEEYNPRNYISYDLKRYKKYCENFWHYLNTTNDSVSFSINELGSSLEWISDSYLKIKGVSLPKLDIKSEIKELFSEFVNSFLDKHIHYTALNSDTFPRIMKSIFLNMLVYLGLLIFTFFVYLIDCEYSTGITLLLVSIFISNTIDLVYIIYESIGNELEITEVFIV